MLHGILEQNQIHDGVSVVVITQGLSETSAHSRRRWEAVVELVIKRGNEVCEHQRLRVVLLVELGHVRAREGLLLSLRVERSEGLQMLGADKTITIDSLALVSPKLDQVVRLLDSLLAGLEHTLEHVRQVTHIELVVEVNGRLLEGTLDLRVELKGSLDHNSD